MPVQLPSSFYPTSRSLRRSGLKTIVAVGAVAAAASLIEAALIPGLAIGAVAVVAPGLLSRRSRRRSRPALPKAASAPKATSAPKTFRAVTLAERRPSFPFVRQLRLKEASLKTISFRVIMTTFDFGFNYVILGELTTAAGLSTISIVAGPFFYFVHETGWTYIRPLLPMRAPKPGAETVWKDYDVLGYRISHALAKTITYRIFATASEFSTNYVVVRDVTTAAWLSAFGFFIGPFVYFAHERLWEGLQTDDQPKRDGPRTSGLIAPPTIDLRPI